MKDNKNKSLFWYGFWANVKVFFAICIIVFGVIFSIVLLFSNHQTLAIITSVFSLVLGGYIGLNAKAQRFDYQRKSGTIIHQGDWR